MIILREKSKNLMARRRRKIFAILGSSNIFFNAEITNSEEKSAKFHKLDSHILESKQLTKMIDHLSEKPL